MVPIISKLKYAPVNPFKYAFILIDTQVEFGLTLIIAYLFSFCLTLILEDKRAFEEIKQHF